MIQTQPRLALVTGAGRNIGRGIALRLARDGHVVGLNGRNREPLEKVAAEIEEAGGTAVVAPGDVTSTADVERMVQDLRSVHGPVGILVNNAVLRFHGAITETSDDDWADVMDVVLGGAFRCSRAVTRGMRESGWGRIVNIAGLSGQRGAAERSAVATAKSGVIGLTKALAMELADSGVTVNCLSPGAIATHRGAWTSRGRVDELIDSVDRVHSDIPVGRLGEVDEVAAACSYLCSEPAGYVTGQVLSVNGGIYV